MVEIPRDQLKLQENERLISPPIVAEPLYGCATAVNVIGFIAGARLDVEVAGAVVVTGAPGGFPMPSGAMIHIPALLTPGQVVRARQKVGSLGSGWSAPITVRDHLTDYPAGPPRPAINPAPVYRCGSRTGVANLLSGCNVWITADGHTVGGVHGAAAHQGVNVAPEYGLGQQVIAHAELCHDPSPPSAQQVSQPPPLPLPPPGFENVYEGSRQITVTNLANGARFTLSRGGIDQGTWSTWGYKHLVGLNSPFSSGETLAASQRLCPGDSPSQTGTTMVQPCSKLPAPVVAPVQDGDTRITLLDFVPDATVRVYINRIKVAESGGPVIQLTQPVQDGDRIDVLQIVGTCVGQTVQDLYARCVAPPVTDDPSALDLFPVGFSEYDGGTAPVLDGTNSIKGTVYYPAESDGTNVPFNQRLAKLGPVPIVLMAHGQHDSSVPNHLGYDYLQQQLARMGIIAVSVYLNETNMGESGPTNIRRRAEIVIKSIAYFQTLSSGGDPIFGGHVDLSRVGLMGHSRGGEAVVVAPAVIALPGVTIKAALALAPTDWGATGGAAPTGYAFMTLLPAADGDVWANDGAKYYDRDRPTPFKSQLYVHHANHNYFNRRWLNDDAQGQLPLMARADHERVLSAYGCAFFRSVLLGHATTPFLMGTMLPEGVLSDNVHLSFLWATGPTTVDNDRTGDWIPQNSLGQPTTQSGGMVAKEYPFSQTAPGRYNNTFYGDEVGIVAQAKEAAGIFRSQLPGPTSIAGRELWIRVAEVYNQQQVFPTSTGFQLGVEATNGAIAWVDSDDVGGVSLPFDRSARDTATKSMLNTLRFRAGCFKQPRRRPLIRAVLLRLNRADGRPLAFDDLQIV